MDGFRDPADIDQHLEAYFSDGERRVAELQNRGPLRYASDGKLHPEIVDAYHRVGMYVFEGLINPAELEEVKTDLLDVLDRLPTHSGSPIDRSGDPAIGAGFDPPVVVWSKPLSDPLGGTGRLKDRHPVKMFEPEPAADAPAEIVWSIVGILQFSDAALRVYGHPDLLSIAAAINGDDFVPFNEALIIKKAGEGTSFAWHQDGMTHWKSPGWNPRIHGFNFMVQLYGSTAANGLWYIPGSHLQGKADIKALIEKTGSNLLPDAVPLLSKPGDVAISNRQLIHASFPNTSRDVRMTLNMGFHCRQSVVGAEGTSIEGAAQIYDAEVVRKRSEVIGYGIDARHQHYPAERPFVYQPHLASGERSLWNEAARTTMRQYNQFDLVI